MTRRRAVLSDCGRYRYHLTRFAKASDGRMVFVMLNPSTADADIDDPTIRRCLGFAHAQGLGGIEVVNLFAYRATKPSALLSADSRGEDIVGPDNPEWMDVALHRAQKGILVAAWGANVERIARQSTLLRFYLQHVRARLESEGAFALRLTKGGHPEHPLYMPADVQPVDLATGEVTRRWRRPEEQRPLFGGASS